jgi:hypothetical protein
MGGSTPNNNVDLNAQSAQAAQALAQQQQQWQAEQTAVNQAANVAQQQANQTTNQQTTQNQTQLQQFAGQNAAQGVGVDATGGPAGIKAANTSLTSSDGLSPADAKLQAAALAASPTSLQSLMNTRASLGKNIVPTGTGLLSSTNVKLGG